MSDVAQGAVRVLPRIARPWLDAIADAQKYFQFWHEKSDRIDRLYADLKQLSETGGDREFQLFWANLEILKPAIYARPPVPVVAPRFRSMRELPRKAAELLERSLILTFETADLDQVMLQIRDDLATNGRGAAWVRLDQTEGRLTTVIEHVDRADFLHEPARKWREVGWVAKRAWLTRDEGIARFGDAFTGVELKSAREFSGEGASPLYEGEKKAEVWEIWSRSRGLVAWVTPGLDEVLDICEPFLHLQDFFPCPRPAYATIERRRLIPVPDFLYYKDQLEEINELTARISALAEGLRMKGFYAAGAGDLAEAVEVAIRQNDEHAILVPVANFAALGGTALRDSIVWLPVAEVAATVKELILLRRELIGDVYQITGLSDIMRGATDPSETAAAQVLKSQYGSLRVRDRRAELVRIARDLARIAGEIIAENYTIDMFDGLTDMDLPREAAIAGEIRAARLGLVALAQDQSKATVTQEIEARLHRLETAVTLEQVAGLLREQRLRPFLLEIETDSTIAADENAEKARRTEFLTALSGAIRQLVPMVTQEPASVSFAIEMMKFAIAPFRAGRSFEGSIDQFAESLRRAAQARGAEPEAARLSLELRRLEFDERKHAEELALSRDEAMRTHELELRKARLAGDAQALEQGTVPAFSMVEIVELLARQNASIIKSMEMVAKAVAAPKKVTTPEGRTYVSEPMQGFALAAVGKSEGNLSLATGNMP